MIVTLLRQHGSLNAGERAGFTEEEAQRLIERGVAVAAETVNRILDTGGKPRRPRTAKPGKDAETPDAAGPEEGAEE